MMRRVRRRLLAWTATGCVTIATLTSSPALADTLSIGATTPSSGSATIDAGKFDGTLPAADWTDTGLLGVTTAWHGTVAVTLFQATGPWVTTSGTHTLTAAASSGAYTGTVPQGYYVVTVSADTGTALSASVAGSEAGPALTGVAHNTPVAVGTRGVTITFNAGVTYAPGDQFTVHVSSLPASAMTLRTAGASQSGAEVLTFQNDTVTVAGGTATVVGTPVQFITYPGALLLSGGTTTVVPGMALTYDRNLVWALAYKATISYTIATGP